MNPEKRVSTPKFSIKGKKFLERKTENETELTEMKIKRREREKDWLFNLAERSKFGEILNGGCKKWTELPL